MAEVSEKIVSKIGSLEDELEVDINIDESNLAGEIRKGKDLIYKWETRYNTLVNKLAGQTNVMLRLQMEKHKWYSIDYEKELTVAEVKIYINGDVDVLKLQGQMNEVKYVISFLKTALSSIREKNRNVKMLTEMYKYEGV